MCVDLTPFGPAGPFKVAKAKAKAKGKLRVLLSVSVVRGMSFGLLRQLPLLSHLVAATKTHGGAPPATCTLLIR